MLQQETSLAQDLQQTYTQTRNQPSRHNTKARYLKLQWYRLNKKKIAIVEKYPNDPLKENAHNQTLCTKP